nr:hypothetical protein [Angustibacter aerolatus]
MDVGALQVGVVRRPEARRRPAPAARRRAAGVGGRRRRRRRGVDRAACARPTATTWGRRCSPSSRTPRAQ